MTTLQTIVTGRIKVLTVTIITILFISTLVKHINGTLDPTSYWNTAAILAAPIASLIWLYHVLKRNI